MSVGNPRAHSGLDAVPVVPGQPLPALRGQGKLPALPGRRRGGGGRGELQLPRGFCRRRAQR